MTQDECDQLMVCEKSPTGRHEWNLPVFRIDCKYCGVAFTETQWEQISELQDAAH